MNDLGSKGLRVESQERLSSVTPRRRTNSKGLINSLLKHLSSVKNHCLRVILGAILIISFLLEFYYFIYIKTGFWTSIQTISIQSLYSHTLSPLIQEVPQLYSPPQFCFFQVSFPFVLILHPTNFQKLGTYEDKSSD